jgi:hypothetical protein
MSIEHAAPPAAATRHAARRRPDTVLPGSPAIQDAALPSAADTAADSTELETNRPTHHDSAAEDTRRGAACPNPQLYVALATTAIPTAALTADRNAQVKSLAAPA